ncbi:MAG: (2Fe-2S)-binding protein [Cyclobacteriaceae bacterium]|nr:(2Fe-2S)-binding protein [Cyclobacteriaceae bacterium]
MATISLTVNKKTYKIEAEDDTPLLWALRENLGLTGTKYGCGVAQCGSCTVLVNGVATRSCVMPAKSFGDAEIITIEGLAENGGEALQDAWIEHDTPQCGYCQAGQIMSAAGLLKANPNPTDKEIDQAMNGNICRCGSYVRIKAAIKTAIKNGGVS